MENRFKKSDLFSKSQYLILISVILNFGFCVDLLLPLKTFAEPKSIGKVIVVSGTIEFRKIQPEAGEIKKVALVPWQKVKFRQPVYDDEEFRTARGSRLKIKFQDNSLMALGPNSKMSIGSYLHKPEEKLRQGIVNVASGMAMYIVNKSQKNKKSHFKIKTKVGSLAARGTHGYISTDGSNMVVANAAGAVETSNSMGKSSVGPMQKNMIKQGKAPSKAVKLTKTELSSVRNVVVGQIGVSAGNSMVEEATDDAGGDEGEEESEEEESGDESAESESEESDEGEEESADSDEGAESSEESADASESSDSGSEGGAEESADDFELGEVFGAEGEFAEVNDPFDASIMSSCKM